MNKILDEKIKWRHKVEWGSVLVASLLLACWMVIGALVMNGVILYHQGKRMDRMEAEIWTAINKDRYFISKMWDGGVGIPAMPNNKYHFSKKRGRGAK